MPAYLVGPGRPDPSSALSSKVSRICFLTWKGKNGTPPANNG